MKRSAGILLPVFSLPGPYGIGTLGKEARAFADFLRKLEHPMHLICVRPTRMDCLFSDFKELGWASRQTLMLDAK